MLLGPTVFQSSLEVEAVHAGSVDGASDLGCL